MNARPVGIEDVAAAAKVSIATVSRYLNKPGVVAPATAERVSRAIERLGYRPNPFAQGLMTRRSQIVGILLPDVHGEFYSELLRGADAEARRRGYHLLVSSEAGVHGREPGARGENLGRPSGVGNGPGMARPPADDRALAPLFRLIDGLAVMISEPNEALWVRVQRSGLPVVLLDWAPDRDPARSGRDAREPGVHSIVVDNTAGAAEAARHLLDSVPPARCYFVGGPKGNFDSAQRADAFLGVLRGAGHRPRPDQAAFGEYSFDWGHRWGTRKAGGTSAERSGDEPLGVLAGNDEIAFGLVRAFQDAGWAVPGRVRVVGFDDTRLASLLRPALSTVRVPLAEIGSAAIGTLIDLIDSRDGRARSVRIATKLIVRESSRA